MKVLFGLLTLTLIASCASQTADRTPQQVEATRNDPPPTEPEAPTVPNFSPFGP
jgi:hypothetical protein